MLEQQFAMPTLPCAMSLCMTKCSSSRQIDRSQFRNGKQSCMFKYKLCYFICCNNKYPHTLCLSWVLMESCAVCSHRKLSAIRLKFLMKFVNILHLIEQQKHTFRLSRVRHRQTFSTKKRSYNKHLSFNVFIQSVYFMRLC